MIGGVTVSRFSEARILTFWSHSNNFKSAEEVIKEIVEKHAPENGKERGKKYYWVEEVDRNDLGKHPHIRSRVLRP